ncbi:MAG: GAF domain-containing protein [Anaerolineae bacterium]|nr:GAF domain-containing protein [Anaerolineae bacterium]
MENSFAGVRLNRKPFLRAANLSKSFGGVQALQSIDLDIYPGEVIGVVGDTDSGKSTLLHLIAGMLWPDAGRFFVRGQPTRLWPSHRAARHGIKAVHQDINVAEHMSALGYIYAGNPPQRRAVLRWLGWWDRSTMRAGADAEFRRLGFDVPPLDCPLHDLTSAQRRMVAFVHATLWSPRLLLLDEPMSALESYQANILRVIQEMRSRFGSVLVVTQNLDDIFRVADRLIVLNAGCKIAERRVADTSEEEIVRLILGSVDDNRMTPAVWALSNYFEVRRQADELDRLNKAIEKRANQLQAHADIARSATSILDRDELLKKTVEIIQQRFHYYYTGIFLVDASGEWLELRGSASRCLRKTESGAVRVRVGEEGMIGWCASTGQSRLANDVTQDAWVRPEAALPEVHSELVLPLRIGNRILGVLDLQCDDVNSFSEDDVVVLQGLADQLAIAIRNADLFETARIARQQADEANRYKSVFLSNMSHELRTPLSAVIGHTQAMLAPNAGFYSKPLPEEYRHDLDTIRKSGEHLLALINDILDLSKIEVGELKLNPTVTALVDILDQAWYTAEGLIHGRPVQLQRSYPDDLPLAWCDKVRTHQVVLNLLANAAKFTEQGSITLNASVAGGEIVISVKDTGIGIPEHLRKVIFKRFRQAELGTSKKYGGTGLGLSISRQFVELQGGRIWVDSEIGHGSVFSFTVRLATPEQLAAAGGAPDTSASFDVRRSVVFEPDRGGWQMPDVRLVLLAQHESPACFAIRQALEEVGCVVELTGVDGLVVEIAEVMVPDLIILDATEPEGNEVLQALMKSPDAAAVSIVVFLPVDQPAPTGLDANTQHQGLIYRLASDQVTPAAVLQAARTCFERTGVFHQDG